LTLFQAYQFQNKQKAKYRAGLPSDGACLYRLDNSQKTEKDSIESVMNALTERNLR